jgi:hypothetical protein
MHVWQTVRVDCPADNEGDQWVTSIEAGDMDAGGNVIPYDRSREGV